MAHTLVLGVATALPAGLDVLLQVGGASKALILGLLAVLVLPMITILFVSYLVDVETLDEERLERVEAAVLEIQDELGIQNDGAPEVESEDGHDGHDGADTGSGSPSDGETEDVAS